MGLSPVKPGFHYNSLPFSLVSTHTLPLTDLKVLDWCKEYGGNFLQPCWQQSNAFKCLRGSERGHMFSK